MDLAGQVGVSQQEVSLLERGHLDGVPLRTLRAVLRALEASVELDIRWRGGAIDRLLDERHAALVAGACRVLAESSWQVVAEATYSVYGERGSVDVLAWRRELASAAVVEVKTELASVEATLRKHDEKVRLASRLIRDREGWTPRVVGRVLVLPEGRTARRQLERAGVVLASAYPLRALELRTWLRAPRASVGGVLLLADTSDRGARQPIVRRREKAHAGAPAAPSSGTSGVGA